MTPERNIVLVGFMGTGKTAVGREVARRLARPFVDVDREIAAAAGMSIPEIFEREGEDGFRHRERDAVEAIAKRPGRVVSTGGGMVLDPANIDRLSETGVLVCLDADIETVLKRVGSNRQRPLLQGPDRRERIAGLMAERAPCYAAIPLHVDTSGKTRSEVAEAVLACVRGHEGGPRNAE